MRKVPLIRQMGQHECGPACLAMILTFYKCNVRLNELSEQCDAQRNGVSIRTLKMAAQSYGLDAKVFQVSADALIAHADSQVPCILFWDNHHFVVLERCDKQQIIVIDPQSGRLEMNMEQFKQHFSDIILSLKPTPQLKKASSPSILAHYVPYLLKHKRVIGLMIVFALAAQMLCIGAIFGIRYLIENDGLTTNAMTDWYMVGGIIASGIGLLFSFLLLRGRLSVSLQTMIGKDLSEALMNRLLKLPLPFFEQRTAGDLVMRAGNIAMLRELLAKNSTTLFLDLLALCCFWIAIASQSVRLSLFAIVLFLLQFTVMTLGMHNMKESIRADLSAQTTSQTFLLESLRAVSFIKSNGLDHSILSKWNRYCDKQNVAFRKRAILDILPDSIAHTMNVGVPILLLWFGLSEVRSGQLSIGSLIGISCLSTAFLLPVYQMMRSIQQFQLTGDVFERIQDIMNTPAEATRESLPSIDLKHTSITLDQVSFARSENEPILDRISVHIPSGSKVALVGRTGSGKTTLSRIVLGLYKPTAGNVLYGDLNLNELNLYEIRKHMGVLLQESFLFNDTVASNISCFRDLSEKQIMTAAQKAGLHDDIMQMSMGYETIIGDNGSLLSGGQRQRLAIARAIASEPSFVIMDEATSNLDTLTESRIDHYFNELRTTRIMITHRLINTRNADFIIVLDQGKISGIGSHHELLASNPIYQQMWDKQIGAESVQNSSPAWGT